MRTSISRRDRNVFRRTGPTRTHAEHTRRLPQPHDHEPERWHKLITLTLTYQTAEQFKAEKEASVAMLDLEMVPVEDLADEAVFYSGVLRVRVGETVL